jgi:sphingomyelin phosphodiesterase acid-like 3
VLARCSKTIAYWLTLVILLVCPGATLAQSQTGQFLLVSDIHFDPFYDASLFPQLSSQPVEAWPTIFANARPNGLNPIGTDTNYALLSSSLDEMRRRIPDPDFILIAGDFLAHDWPHKYDGVAPVSHLMDAPEYRSFTAKVIRLIAQEFQRRYPSSPILPALGNNDSYCGDYMVIPDGPFLKMFASAWGPLLGADQDGAAFQTTFCQGGYYRLKLPKTTQHRAIVLNSVFFSVNYDNVCGSATQTPALDQLRWLASSLEEARAAGETVWLLLHIPPGLDSYGSSKSVQQGGQAIAFWQPELTSRFLQLVQQYQSTLQVVFAGHTHMDDFRVIRLEKAPVLWSKIAPAISPIYGNNPGFQTYQYDRATGALENYQTYYLADLAPEGKPNAPGNTPWALEYDFRAAYGFSALNSSTITALADRVGTAGMAQQQYIKYYSVSAAPEITPATVNAYDCAILNVTPAQFQMCIRGVPEPKRAIRLFDRPKTHQPVAPK